MISVDQSVSSGFKPLLVRRVVASAMVIAEPWKSSRIWKPACSARVIQAVSAADGTMEVAAAIATVCSRQVFRTEVRSREAASDWRRSRKVTRALCSKGPNNRKNVLKKSHTQVLSGRVHLRQVEYA